MALVWFRDLDELLRGRKTLPETLAAGKIDLKLGPFTALSVLLGATYGAFMGLFSVTSRDPRVYQQLFASTVKFPALFIITLIVTFPSLYVFNALLGSRLRFMETLRLLIAAIVVNAAVAASLAPILGFFTLSTTSYPFMIILNVGLLAISGAVGLGFLMQTLRRLASAAYLTAPPVATPMTTTYVNGSDDIGLDAPARPAIAPLPDLRESRNIFRIWVLIYGLVGAQTGWLLRPFIGSPHLEFSWFRNREGNFFHSVWIHFQALMNG